MTVIQTNPDRYNATLHESCVWGAIPKSTGMNRLALNDDDKQVRHWFIEQAKRLGCEIKVDEMGNIFAIRPGTNNDLPPIGIGSHLDTQPRGGRYDGIAGVQAGLEILRTLHENNIQTYAPIAAIDWTNEEGARFPKAMVSSGVWSECIPLEDAYALQDINDPQHTMKSELERIGFKGDTKASYKANPLSAHFEMHIEQGPILEAEKIQLGIVSGVQGMRWYDAEVVGFESHTGTTPMDRRTDALVATAIMIQAIETCANEHNGLGTVGVINSEPQSTNTIPGKVSFSIDCRHSSESALDTYTADLFGRLEKIAKERGVEFKCSEKWRSKQLDFDADIIGSLTASAKENSFSIRSMQSGAGHDSCYTSQRVPTGMLFIPCHKGISHNPAEYSSPEDLARGVQTLLGGVLRYDNLLKQKHS
ncbi:hypothetical protein TRVA0_017S00958 [Trichomonascus vanleenenianus]|uniref:M20 family metallo-hydrolase n=1 Tax=Trichomonascus vanleenenianus TaxID=2268995 RepID=UPI003ECB12BC